MYFYSTIHCNIFDMKKMIFFLFIALSFTSCTVVKFESSQPSATAPLEEFPEKMLGTFISEDKDTLRITLDSFIYSNGKEISVYGSLTDSNVVLKKYNNIYLLNLKDDRGWDIFPLKLSRNKLRAYYVNLDPNSLKLIESLKQTSSVKEIRTEEGKFEHYLIAPSDKEFKRLLKKKLFSSKTEFTRIK